MRITLGGSAMKIMEMILSGVVKKGILYEARNLDSEIEIPLNMDGHDINVKVNIKCEHMTLRIERD
jgi:hypothetical protein